MRFVRKLLFIVVVPILWGCDDDRCLKYNFGETSYYPSFLFWEADTVGVTKTFVFDFNEDAKSDGDSCDVTFEFVDNNGVVIPPEELEIKVNGIRLANNQFVINSTWEEAHFSFRFLPLAKSGIHQGTLRLVDHHLLDRVDNFIIEANGIDLFKWSLYFDRQMNPLSILLMWIGIFLFILLLVWFVFLKPIKYPRIRVSRVMMNSEAMMPVDKRVNGARMIVISSAKRKQGFFSRLFTGRIVNIVDPIWEFDWDMVPKRGKKILKPNFHGKYTISPLSIELRQYDEYTITTIDNNNININIKIQ